MSDVRGGSIWGRTDLLRGESRRRTLLHLFSKGQKPATSRHRHDSCLPSKETNQDPSRAGSEHHVTVPPDLLGSRRACPALEQGTSAEKLLSRRRGKASLVHGPVCCLTPLKMLRHTDCNRHPSLCSSSQAPGTGLSPPLPPEANAEHKLHVPAQEQLRAPAALH